ncbi:thiamine-phosphate kinase [Salinibacter ruber]|uniref:Thiamine-monophosphate kinase n=1 Tax=Salinibacter ruber TaxID=146919 RepID=A0A9X2Q2H8_9BACT|nr:thiamine-phosphate kinase [Salinibacter ruber]MCS3659061.1 thiamine-monophosphate kinase [Salinibacter ruber]MCS3708864.1 thiamine-monophosphate kinase [Salinibacter ruber]
MESQEQSDQTALAEIGEFGLIALLRDTLGEPTDDTIVSGIADDAAVYRTDEDRVHVMTTDTLVEGVHFDRAFMPMEHLGFKALSVNVSDVVAMNASPRYATVSIGIPQNVSVEMITTVYEGLKQACDAYDMHIVGGDTNASHGLSISISVVGAAAEEDVVYRTGAQVGDKICVTGDLGSSYAGLKVLLRNRERLQEQEEDFEPDLDPYSYVIRRHLAPPAQLKTVRDWGDAGVQPHALIDISDGLSAEVHHICEAGDIGAQLYEPALPIDPETRNTATDFGEDVTIYALFGGEDYELVFTIPEDELDALDPQTYTVVGEIVEPDDPEHPIKIQRAHGENVPLQPGGFDHFDGPSATAPPA